MRVFVSEHAVIGLGIDELCELRHLDEVAGWCVECALAAVPNRRAARYEEPLGCRNALILREIFDALHTAPDLRLVETINLGRVEDEITACNQPTLDLVATIFRLADLDVA